MGSSKKQTVGYRYRMGLHMGICLECDALLEIRAGDRVAWVGNVTDTGTTSINVPKLFGGDEREGGIQGTLDVMMGRPGQMPNAYLAGQQGGFQPGYRGFLGLVYRGLITSNNPYIKNWEVRVRSILKGWNNDTPWYPERAPIPLKAPQAAAVYMALDCSGSMDQPTPGGGTRRSNMKVAVVAVLEMLKQSIVAAGGVLNLRIQLFGTFASGYTWLNATATDIEAAKSFVNSSGNMSGTNFEAAMSGLSAFYGSEGQRIGMLVTDGEPDSEANAIAARAMVDAVAGLKMHGINIDLENTTYTAIVDNTGNPVPVVAGGDPSALAAALADAILGGRLGMNPVHILYQALTDPDWGMGYPAELIDDANFQTAANTLYAEGFGLSLKWVNQSSVKAFTQTIADHASMNYGQSRTTGKFEIQLLRQDYDVDDLPVFNKKNCRVVKYQRPALTDTVNEIIVEYVDIETGKDASTAPLQNLANIMAQGRIVSQKLSFPGLPTNSLATRVGMRELQSRSSPVWKMSLEFHRGEATKLKSGKPFVLDMLDTPLGVKVVLRAVEINYGTTVDAMITADCVEDVFGMPDSAYVGEPTEPPPPPDTSPKPATGAAFEVPYRELLQTLGATATAALPVDAGFVGAMAQRPAGVPLNFSLFTRIPPDEYVEAAQGDFAPVAVVSAPVPREDGPSTISYGSGSNLDSMEIGDAAWLGEGPLAELVRIDARDAGAGTITIGRGCGDTIPREWAIGTRLWAFDDFSAGDPEQYVAGETVNAKVATNATGGQQDLTTATDLTVAIQGRAARPYPPHQLKVNGEAQPDETVMLEFDLSWMHRDRVLQADTLIDAAAASIGPEPGTTYTARFYLDDVLVDEVTGIEGGQLDNYGYPGDGNMRVELFAVRDGLESLFAGSIAFPYSGALTLTGTLPNPTIGVAYIASLTASGGIPPYTWTLGAGAPPGLSIDSETGLITGTPTATGPFNFDVTVTDSDSNVAISPQTVEVLDDPYLANVVALLHLDGSPNDVKGHAFSAVGTVAYSAGKFGDALTLATGDSGLSSAVSVADFNFGTGDFTIEAWIKLAGGFSGGALISQFDVSPVSGWQIYVTGAGVPQFYHYNGAGSYPINPTGIDLRDGLWHHVAVSRAGGTLRMFVDGVQPSGGSVANTVNYGSTGLYLSIGYQRQGSARYPFRGQIDEVRLTKAGRYTANFAPPPGPFPDPA